MTWIEQVMLATRTSESPRKYYYWAGLSAIAAVVKNQVFLDKFHYKLYPNIYVLLIGRSGLRKGPPIALAKNLVEHVDNTKVIKGRSSIQAVISDLSKAITKPNGGPPLTDAAGFLVSSEFASFLIQDPAALTVLTDLYDGNYHQEWINTTKTSGAERLKNPCITLIGASNEIHFRDAVPTNALGGGFVARTFIIYADKKSSTNALTRQPETYLSIPELGKHLVQLASLKGQFKWSDAGRDRYESWYTKFSDQEITDSTGTIDRLHDHILKTAMLVSLSRKTDLVLEDDDIREAIMACQDFIPGARRVTMGLEGKSANAPGTAQFLRELLSRPPDYTVSRSKMLQRNWSYFDVFDMDKIAESLQAQRAIEILQARNDSNKLEIFYKLNPKVAENYQKQRGGE